MRSFYYTSLTLPIVLFIGACANKHIQHGSNEQPETITQSISEDNENTLPNIVIIMADDVGPGDIASYHREYTGRKGVVETPTLDSLASKGISLTQAYAPTALCSPTRYSVMSGNSPFRSYAPWGVWQKFRPSPFKKSDATIGRVAKQAGYNTGFIGKWHLGGDFYIKNTQTVFRGNDMSRKVLPADLTHWVAGNPNEVGFDYDFTIPSGVQGPIYLAYENSYWYPLDPASKIIYVDESTAYEPKVVSDKGAGMGDSHWNTRSMNMLIANKAEQFIREKAQESSPFLLTYWSPAVHLPHMPPEEIDGEKMSGTTPSKHIDMIRVLDKEVSVIIDALKETGEYDNTLIIFTSDNGGLYDSKGQEAGHNSAGEWSGYKNSSQEGGQRVPFIAVWKDKIKAGTKSDVLASGSDIVATIAALTNVPLKSNQALDSWNLLGNLLGEPATERSKLGWQAGTSNEYLYREGDLKLIIKSDRKMTKMLPVALYNLKDNPKENPNFNLINDVNYNQTISEMLSRYLELRKNGQRNPNT